MAHELKTPLTLIRVHLDDFLFDPRFSDPDISSRLNEVIQEVDRLNLIIGEFLSWTKAQTQFLSVSKVIKLNEFLKAYLNSYHFIYGQRVFLKNHAPLLKIRGNEMVLTLILNNLLSNALKYSNTDSQIKIEVLGSGMLKIINRGPPVPESVLERLGEPFNVGYIKEAGQFKTGTGLGLAWVQTLSQGQNWFFSLSSFGGETTAMLKLTPI